MEKLEEIKQNLRKICYEKGIEYENLLTYLIISELNCGVLHEKSTAHDLQSIKHGLIETDKTLWLYQPEISENEELAMAMQYARDILNVIGE